MGRKKDKKHKQTTSLVFHFRRGFRGEKYLFSKMQFVITIFIGLSLFAEGFFLNYQFRNQLQNNFNESSHERLTQTSTTVEMMFDSIINVTRQVYTDRSFNDYMTSTQPKTVSEQLYASNKLDQIKYSNELIDSVHLYISTTEELLMTDYGLVDIEDANNTDFLAWYNDKKSPNIMIAETRPVVVSQMHMEPKHTLSIYVRLPNNSSATFPGALIVNILQNDIYNRVISAMGTGDEEETYIVNAKGQIVLAKSTDQLYLAKDNLQVMNGVELGSSGGFFHIESGHKYLVTYMFMQTRGWSIVNVLPFDQMNVIMNSISILIVIAWVLLTIGSFLISAMITSRLTKPIDELVSYAPEEAVQFPDGKRSLAHVKNYYIETVEKNHDLRKRLDNSLPQLRERFVTMLLQGAIEDREEIYRNMTTLDIDLPVDELRVCIISVQSSYGVTSLAHAVETLSAEVVIQEWFKEKKYRCITAEIRPGHIAAIFTVEGNTQEDINTAFIQFHHHIRQQTDHMISLGVCDNPVSVERLKESYFIAQDALSYGILNNNGFCITNKPLCKKSAVVHYPFILEESLLKLIRICDYDNAMAMIKKILFQMSSDSSENFFLLYQMIIQLNNTLIKLMTELNIPLEYVYMDRNSIRKILDLKNLHEIESFFSMLIRNMIKMITEVKEDKQNLYYKMIIEYLKQNYYRQEITLELMSDEILLSHTYINQILRTKENTTFTPLLNKIRVEKAVRLLKDEDTKIKDIAGLVGYGSSGYFIRVFKEMTGFTPGQMKKTFE